MAAELRCRLFRWGNFVGVGFRDAGRYRIYTRQPSLRVASLPRRAYNGPQRTRYAMPRQYLTSVSNREQRHAIERFQAVSPAVLRQR